MGRVYNSWRGEPMRRVGQSGVCKISEVGAGEGAQPLIHPIDMDREDRGSYAPGSSSNILWA